MSIISCMMPKKNFYFIKRPDKFEGSIKLKEILKYVDSSLQNKYKFKSDIYIFLNIHILNLDENYLDKLINILGADHTGYIKRISAAVRAISNNKTNLFCKVSQLVKLFKDGKPFKMSKRAGEFITLKDLQKEKTL